MSVERRRTIALAGTALLVAGALGLYAATDRSPEEAAVAVVEAAPPADPQPASAPVAQAAAAAPPAQQEPVAAAAAAQTVPEAVAETVPEAVAEVVPEAVAEVVPEAVPEAVREIVQEAAPPQAPLEIAAVDPARTEAEPTAPVPLTQRAAEPEQAPEPEPVAADAEPAAVFDIVRVEPTGDAVIAGRARAGETIELLRNGVVHDVVVADATGAFAFVPPPLPPGTHEITLQARAGDAAPRRSRESVTVVVDRGLAAAPIVALAAPDAPTRILSRPDPAPGPAPAAAEAPPPVAEIAPEAAPAAAPAAAEAPPAEAPPRPADAVSPPAPTQLARADAAGPVVDRRAIRVATVEAETGGGLFVSGEGTPSASVRLYLNETFVGRASADHTGSISFAIRRGVRPGLYRVRLDDVDPRDGAVLSRAEVEFEMPQALVAPAPEAQPAATAETALAAAAPARDAAGPASAPVSASPQAAPPAPSPVAATPAANAPARAPAQAVAAAVPAEPPREPEPAPAPEPEPEPAREATLTIPEVNTALVSRGDSLWRISRRVYGAGIRYTVIFDANQEQIRDPNLIFPGQIFVLPGEAAVAEDAPR